MSLSKMEILDELSDIKYISIFLAEGLMSGVYAEMNRNSCMSDSGLTGANTIVIRMMRSFDKLIQNFEEMPK